MQRLRDTSQKWLLARQRGPCITIYVDLLDLHDAVKKYSAMLQKAQSLIEKDQSHAMPSSYMRPLVDFMSEIPKLGGLEGVGIFRSRSVAGYIPLYAKTQSEVIVADSFHVEPILSLLQESQKYQVLTLGAKSARMFLATNTSLEELETFALEDDLTPGEKPETIHVAHAFWKIRVPGAQGEDEIESRQLFNRLLQEKISPGIEHSGHPLILAGQAHFLEMYKKINSYPATIELVLSQDPDAMSDLGLHDELEALVRDLTSQEAFNLVNEYLDRYEEGEATDAIRDIARFAIQGQIETLLVERGRKLWGMYDRRTGKLETHEGQRDSRDGDVLDDFSQMVVGSGGTVVVLNSHFMPSASPIAAILRRAKAA